MLIVLQIPLNHRGQLTSVSFDFPVSLLHPHLAGKFTDSFHKKRYDPESEEKGVQKCLLRGQSPQSQKELKFSEAGHVSGGKASRIQWKDFHASFIGPLLLLNNDKFSLTQKNKNIWKHELYSPPPLLHLTSGKTC